MIKYLAQYKAPDGAIYSCPVVLSGQQWKLQTAFGLRDIAYFLQEETSPSGLIEFENFKAYADAGVRVVDLNTANFPSPPRPVKPAVKPEPAIVPAPASVRKPDNWNPQPLSIPGSKSTQLDERWQPRFNRLNLERTQRGDLMVGKCLGVDPNSKERFYSCQCSCGKTIQATQSDLLLSRVTSCGAK